LDNIRGKSLGFLFQDIPGFCIQKSLKRGLGHRYPCGPERSHALGMMTHHNMLRQTTVMKGANQTNKVTFRPSKSLTADSMHDFHEFQLLIVFLRLSKLGRYYPKNRVVQQDNVLISKSKIQPMVEFWGAVVLML
jgi:hypothetical protein